MKAQVGLYKFGRHYNHWGIWQYNYVSETGSSARFIKDVYSYEEAVKEVVKYINAHPEQEVIYITDCHPANHSIIITKHP